MDSCSDRISAVFKLLVIKPHSVCSVQSLVLIHVLFLFILYSINRIPPEGAVHLAVGLKGNNNLRILNVGVKDTLKHDTGVKVPHPVK